MKTPTRVERDQRVGLAAEDHDEERRRSAAEDQDAVGEDEPVAPGAELPRDEPSRARK